MSEKLKKAWFNEATSEYFTPKCRLLYPTLIEPKVNKKFPNNPPKYSASLLIPASADISVIVGEVQRQVVALYGNDWKELDPAVKLPVKKTKNFEALKDFAEEYPHFLRVSANADYPPSVFGPDLKPAKKEASEIYGGRWCVAALNIWGPKPENKNINRFIGLGVQRVQLLDHDDPIATGRVATAEGFDAAAISGNSDSVFAGGDNDGLLD